jgi:hypothetical protein
MRKLGIILIILAVIFYAGKERLLGWDAFYNPDSVAGDWDRGSNTYMREHPNALEPGVFYNYLTLFNCRLITFLTIGFGVVLICQPRQKPEAIPAAPPLDARQREAPHKTNDLEPGPFSPIRGSSDFETIAQPVKPHPRPSGNPQPDQALTTSTDELAGRLENYKNAVKSPEPVTRSFLSRLGQLEISLGLAAHRDDVVKIETEVWGQTKEMILAELDGSRPSHTPASPRINNRL